jgi:hypothetical protein
MSSPALQWFGGDGHTSYGSRGTAALLAIILNLAFLYLFAIALRFVLVPASPAVESMLTRLVDQPRGQYSESAVRAISVHLSRPALRVPDTPPAIRIEVPVEPPKVQQPSAIQASLPPGTSRERFHLRGAWRTPERAREPQSCTKSDRSTGQPR